VKNNIEELRLNPDDATAYNLRALSKMNLEDYEGAILDFTKAIELDSNYHGTYYERGRCKYLLEDYKEAIQDFTKAIGLNPSEYVYYDRGMCKYLLEDFKGAIEDYTKIIELNPKCDDAYYERGRCKYHFVGEEKSACMDWSKAVELGNVDAIDKINKYCK
jgi:tetratricopeptide (TPR) repeat protein